MYSIVIPLYNKEKEILKTLESVLNQKFQDFEVVVVNDGSTDKSEEIVRSFKDDRIKLINQVNGGVSAARNRGVLEAKNKWIAFLDADDLWETDKLEKVNNIIENNKGVTWLFSGYRTLKGSETYDHIYKKGGFLKDALDDLNKGLSIQTSTVVVKKKYFEEDENLLFQIGVNNSEDREVWYKLIFKYPNPYYIKEVLTYYIKDGTTESLTNTNVKGIHFLELGKRLEKDISSLPLERRKKIDKYLKSFNRQALWNYWMNKDLTNEHIKYLDKNSLYLQSMLEYLPYSLKKVVVKLISYI